MLVSGRIKKWLFIACCIPFVSVLSAASSSDYAQITEAEASAYKRGEYTKSLKYGIYALKEKPTDPIARYYVAASLAGLNRKEEAAQQYEQAAAFTHDPKLIANIQAGLQNLTKPAAPAPAKTATTRAATTRAATTKVDDAKVMEKETSDQSKDLTTAQQQALDAAKREIDVFRKEADRDIARIHDEEASQLSGVEQYEWKEKETNGRTERVYEQSSAYTDLFEKLKKADEPRISEINEQFLNRKAQIEKAANLRVSAYEEASRNGETQQKMGNGLTQVMPLGSNMYVKNLVNYGTENRVPELKSHVRMQSLDAASNGASK